MPRAIGLWIDHRKAVIVVLTEDEETVYQIRSNLEKHVRYSGTAHSDLPNDTTEDKRDHRYLNHVNRYYEKVMAHLQDAEAVLIMGPGEAKTELIHRLEASQYKADIETVDKLTVNQIVARVKDHFRQIIPSGL